MKVTGTNVRPIIKFFSYKEIKSSLPAETYKMPKPIQEADSYISTNVIKAAPGKNNLSAARPDNRETKNSRIIRNPDGSIKEYYWQYSDGEWIRVDKHIDKSKTIDTSSPVNFYLQRAKEINTFLRTGKFYNHEFINGKLPEDTEIDENMPGWIKDVINTAKTFNREVLEQIPAIDKFAQSSTLNNSLTVYRDAPYTWMDKAENGILTDKAFVSTSLEPHASMEYLIGDNERNSVTYKIHLPKGTKYGNLTHTSEKEILLPRNARFKVVGYNELEYIPPKSMN